MKKSVIALAILLPLMFNTVNANIDPTLRKILNIEAAKKNLAPITIAVVQNDYKTVKRFLELGSDIEIKDKIMGMTPIMFAARYNSVALLQLLVDNGANIKATSKYGFTALKYAKLSNATDAIMFLEALD